MTVYPRVKFLPNLYGDHLCFEVNLVDFPGLLDTRGHDQQILDMMKEKMRVECP